MDRQKSFESDVPALYLVPTPIGNLSEMSPRAIEILKSVDVIACEDTRTSGIMLRHFDISKRLIACHNFNEEASMKGIIELLDQKKNVALISDAGYPLINDPGQNAVPAVIEKGYKVIPVSGPSAFLDGLVASGLIAQPFLFIGFLPQGNGDREKKLKEYADYPMTMIFYEAPHRIHKMMDSCLKILGDRKCTLARELTKVHEEFLRGTISEIIPVTDELKGEMVLVVEGCHKEEKAVSDAEIAEMIEKDTQEGMSLRDAIKEVSKRTGLGKNRISACAYEGKKNSAE
jgi:16S rRNA (cytidine1402-2'-O)-methyltransferase